MIFRLFLLWHDEWGKDELNKRDEIYSFNCYVLWIKLLPQRRSISVAIVVVLCESSFKIVLIGMLKLGN